MQSVTVTASEAGRRLDRYLMKLLPKASRGWIFKNLRGNGFRINGKRVRDPEYVMQSGDVLAMYVSDAQLQDFGFEMVSEEETQSSDAKSYPQVPVVYEDENLVVFNKPAGLLSQKNTEDSVSLTEIGMDYLYQNGLEKTRGFKPGVSNRLDQNTSGAVIMAKNLEAAQAAAVMIRERDIDKYYYAIVAGCAEWSGVRDCIHYFSKDKKANKAYLYDTPQGGQQVQCKVSVVAVHKEQQISLLRVQLITGKSHQIRSQLSHIGYPILGDPKYRSVSAYQADKKRFGIDHQMLCAVELHVRKAVSPLQYLADRHIYAQLPEDMNSIVTHYLQ